VLSNQKRKSKCICVSYVVKKQKKKMREVKARNDGFLLEEVTAVVTGVMRKNIREINGGRDGFLFYILVIKHKR
jgi:hypothetical protein